MSDYTPTEDRVRFAHIDRRCFEADLYHFERYSDEEYGREFDRFIAAIKADALRGAAIEIEAMGVEPWNRLTPATRALRMRATRIEENR